MKTLICPACGARLTVKDGETRVKCSFCEVETLIPQSNPTVGAPSQTPFSKPAPQTFEQPVQNPSSLPTLDNKRFGPASILFIVLVVVVFICILYNFLTIFTAANEARERTEKMQEEAMEQREEILKKQEEFFNN